MQKSQTPARMARLVARWQGSGESAAGFARQHGIPTWTFWYWRRKLASASSPAMPAPAFVPVQVTSDAEAWVLEVAFRGGERLQVRAGVAHGMLTLSPAVRIYLATAGDPWRPPDRDCASRPDRLEERRLPGRQRRRPLDRRPRRGGA